VSAAAGIHSSYPPSPAPWTSVVPFTSVVAIGLLLQTRHPPPAGDWSVYYDLGSWTAAGSYLLLGCARGSSVNCCNS